MVNNMTESKPAGNQLSLIDILDMELSISIDPGTELTDMSFKFGISGEVGFNFSEESPEVVMAFHNSAEQHLELRIFFEKFDAVEHGGVWRIRRKVIKATKELRYIRSLLDLPSMVLVTAFISDGKYHVRFILHHDDVEGVSRILLEAAQDSENLKIDYLGPSPGIKEILSSVDIRTSLRVFEIELTPPEDETKPDKNPLGDIWTRIAKMPSGADRISAVYFFPDGVNGMKKIRQAVTSNPFVSSMNALMNRSRMLAIASIYEHDKPDFVITTILPSTMSEEFVSVISDSAKKMPEWKPVLRRITGIREWMER